MLHIMLKFIRFMITDYIWTHSHTQTHNHASSDFCPIKPVYWSPDLFFDHVWAYILDLFACSCFFFHKANTWNCIHVCCLTVFFTISMGAVLDVLDWEQALVRQVRLVGEQHQQLAMINVKPMQLTCKMTPLLAALVVGSPLVFSLTAHLGKYFRAPSLCKGFMLQSIKKGFLINTKSPSSSICWLTKVSKKGSKLCHCFIELFQWVFIHSPEGKEVGLSNKANPALQSSCLNSELLILLVVVGMNSRQHFFLKD